MSPLCGVVVAMGLVRELLLPRDDRVVALQIVVVLTVGVIGVVAARRHPEVRLLVTGMVLLTLAGMGLRALH